jgi:hypothetical protein
MGIEADETNNSHLNEETNHNHIVDMAILAIS